MSGHKPFSILRDKLYEGRPEAKAASDVRVEEFRRASRDAEKIATIRTARVRSDITEVEAFYVHQSTLSIEGSEDEYISALRERVEALGGQLVIRAEFPDQVLNILSPPES
jgi:hypothetical protein